MVQLSAMFFGIELAFGGELTKVTQAAKMAEEAGIDQLVLFDHVVMGTRTDRYPFGKFPVPPEYPWMEPLTVLAAIAASTQRIRIGTSVLITPLRPAPLLAKTAATIDVLSGGRLDLGLGAGWQREEFEASNIDYTTRGARFDDTVRACKALWRDSPTSFESECFSFHDIYCEPRPVQEELPLWFGGPPNALTARRIAELGVGWIPMTTKPDELAPAIELMKEHFITFGRKPESLGVRAQPPTMLNAKGRPDLQRTLDGMQATLDAGATVISLVPTAFAHNEEQLGHFFETFASVNP